MHTWGGEEQGARKIFEFFYLWDRSVGLGEQLWGRSLEGPSNENPVSRYPGGYGGS